MGLRMSKNPYASAEYKRNRKIVLEAAHYQCHYCANDANTADHIIPVSMGGTHEISNLLPACTSCNSTRKNKVLHRMRYWNKRFGL